MDRKEVMWILALILAVILFRPARYRVSGVCWDLGIDLVSPKHFPRSMLAPKLIGLFAYASDRMFSFVHSRVTSGGLYSGEPPRN
jgi:hypothetical protein